MEPPTHIWNAAQTVDLVEFIQKQELLAKAFLDPSTTIPSDRCLFQKKLCLQLLQRTEWMEWMRREKWVILGEKGLRPTEKWGEGNPVAERLAWLQMQHIRICTRLRNYDSPAALGKDTPERKIWEEYKKKGDSAWYFAYHKLWMKHSPAGVEARTAVAHPLAKTSLRDRIGTPKAAEEGKTSKVEEEEDDDDDDDDIEFVEPLVKAKGVVNVGSKGVKRKEPEPPVDGTTVQVSFPEPSAGKVALETLERRQSGSTIVPVAAASTSTLAPISTPAPTGPMSQISNSPTPSRRPPSGPSRTSATPESPHYGRPPVSRSTPAGPSKLPSTSRPFTPPIVDNQVSAAVTATSARSQAASPSENSTMHPPPSRHPAPKRPRPTSPSVIVPKSGANDAGNPIIIDSDEDGDEEDNTPLTRPVPKSRSSPPLTRRKLHHDKSPSNDTQSPPPTIPPSPTTSEPPTPPLPSSSILTGNRRHIESPPPPRQSPRSGIPTPEPTPDVVTPPSDINQILNPRGYAKETERLRRLAKMKSPPLRPSAILRREMESSDDESSVDEDSPLPENQYEGQLILETGGTMLNFEHKPSLGTMGPRLSFRDDVEDGGGVGSSGAVTPPAEFEDVEMKEAEEAEELMAGIEEIDDESVPTRTSTPALPIPFRPPTPTLPLHHSNSGSSQSSDRWASPEPPRSSHPPISPDTPPSPDNSASLGTLERPDAPKPGYQPFLPSEVERSSVTPPPFVTGVDVEMELELEMDEEEEEEDDDMLNLSGILGDEDDFLSALGGVVGLTT